LTGIIPVAVAPGQCEWPATFLISLWGSQTWCLHH